MAKKHKWEQMSGFSYRCKECLTIDGVRADWCDTDGISKEMKRITDRNDCRGKKRKSRKKPKLIFTRRELLKVTDNHGGHLSGYCTLCGSCGWIDDIDHHAGCILADPSVTKVRLEAVKSDAELIEELRRLEKAEASATKREAVFKQIPQRYKEQVCLGCGKADGCGCPAGIGWALKSKSAIKKLLRSST